jgi:hypothetical protein
VPGECEPPDAVSRRGRQSAALGNKGHAVFVPWNVGLIILMFAVVAAGDILKRLLPDCVETIDVVMAALEIFF